MTIDTAPDATDTTWLLPTPRGALHAFSTPEPNAVQRAAQALLAAPRVLLSPHVAGPTWETYPQCGAQAMERLAGYLRGEAPDNRVTLEIYDRAT